ncbi:sensor domain-containing diguanylate cyclase [Pseudooceanicola sp. CBS1P-1]|uniref:diguanylate cyclase n=1 Tax=Pseudooceanicola albus TaxID=2692189 RepID=A0A6L7G324_9RHOB|nr:MULTISPECIES: sensor domain-containing diguanylate cyclase [Pseudooceanicola]MBT9382442.1 sensor domain-containing diguanylate cyclase [Pseudooceanicola endophyticus]MXN16983.1 diguanylate cyclase [Pseudooceanicola albus]
MGRDRRKLDDEAGRLAALRRTAILDTPPEAPFDRITALVCTVLGVPMAHVSLVDRDRVWLKSAVGLKIRGVPRDRSFCTLTIQTFEPMMIPDATQDARVRDLEAVTGEIGIRSYLGIPLESPDGYVLGSLCALDTRPRSFTEAEIATLKGFARLVMSELELRQIAHSDALTGAMTRRGWMEAAEREIAESRRDGMPAALLLMDIDHFKRINDTHGHASGDLVLREVAQTCFAELREADLLARIGGEEFAALLPLTDTEGALALAERLRAAISGRLLRVEGGMLHVTASFGVAGLTPGITGIEDWLSAADALLYRAKMDGRNLCRVA